MKIVNIDDFLNNLNFFVEEAKKGKIFIYPTDTIYGIGGLFPTKLNDIYKIKKRSYNKKISIIIPYIKNMKFSLQQILDIPDNQINKLLPIIKNLRKINKGFTIIGIFKKSIWNNLNEFSKNIYFDKTIGVRILNHPFQKFINNLGENFITTSANISNQETIKNIKNLPKYIYDRVDWIIDGGILNNPPSVLIKINGDNINILER